MRMILITVVVVAVWAGSAAAQQTGTFTDSRDGQKYKTVKIDKQTWMAQNLNYQTESGSWCYNDSASYCKQYGRLYGWKTATTVCPNGWKLPDTADWNRLAATAGGWETAGSKLKSKSGWNRYDYKNVSGNGTDNYGFSALPGGGYYRVGFSYAGEIGYWWTATEGAARYAHRRDMRYKDNDVFNGYNDKGDDKKYGYSVRCVADNGAIPSDSIIPSTYAVTVSSAGTGAAGRGAYAAGATVSINAGTAPTAQLFKNWMSASNGVTFANANSATTTFTMPSNAVTVTAVFVGAFAAEPSFGTLTDNRDGQKYKTVKIGKQTWMAQNLNYQTESGSWCYDNKADNCKKYGRLYDWTTAKTVCPKGWKLPSREDWDYLGQSVGGKRSDIGNIGWYGVGKRLKSKSGWNQDEGESGDGIDDFGFSALPGGRRSADGKFNYAGDYGQWWTAIENDRNYTYTRYMVNDEDYLSKDIYNLSNKYGHSVRCVADNGAIPSGSAIPSTYAVTVSSAGTGAAGSGAYAAGATVSINAGTAPTAQRFKNWTSASNGVTFANANSATTTFTMPSNAATVTAVFEAAVIAGTLADSRDGKTYKTVKIGKHTWMAQNLNYQTESGSWCYKDSISYCKQYGRLYDWKTAATVCPKGWKLPSRKDWNWLVATAGGEEIAGEKLKSESGWNKNGNGTNDFGFSALPGGFRNSSGNFLNVGSSGSWWAATEDNTGRAYSRAMHYDGDGVYGSGYDYDYFKSHGKSVRCVEEDQP